jgi:hypothetical protein
MLSTEYQTNESSMILNCKYFYAYLYEILWDEIKLSWSLIFRPTVLLQRFRYLNTLSR